MANMPASGSSRESFVKLGGVVSGRVRGFVPLPSPHSACSAHPATNNWGARTTLIDRLLRWLYLFINVFSVYINPVDRTKVGCKRFLDISVKLVQSNLSFMTAKPFSVNNDQDYSNFLSSRKPRSKST